jgi:hypothetical protein
VYGIPKRAGDVYGIERRWSESMFWMRRRFLRVHDIKVMRIRVLRGADRLVRGRPPSRLFSDENSSVLTELLRYERMGDRGVARGRGRPPHQRPGTLSTGYAQICSIGVHFDNSATFMSRTRLPKRFWYSESDLLTFDQRRNEVFLLYSLGAGRVAVNRVSRYCARSARGQSAHGQRCAGQLSTAGSGF